MWWSWYWSYRSGRWYKKWYLKPRRLMTAASAVTGIIAFL